MCSTMRSYVTRFSLCLVLVASLLGVPAVAGAASQTNQTQTAVEAVPTPTFVFTAMEVQRWWNATHGPNIDRATATRVATWFNVVTYSRIATYLQALQAAQVPNAARWDRVAQCESGGNWSINTGNGFYGGLQFSLSTWRSVGGVGYPHQNSREEQIRRAERLRVSSGIGHWPHCGSLF